MITRESLAGFLRSSKTGYEVFTEVAVVTGSARTGIYIGPVVVAREAYQLGVTTGSSIYHVTSSVEITINTFQGDKNLSKAKNALAALVDDPVLTDGYHERSYSEDNNTQGRSDHLIVLLQFKKIEVI